jgi:pyruvate kinase
MAGVLLSRVELKRRRTKIVSTLGPASSSDEVVRQLIEAGVNVFRLNFSHGTHEDHRASFERVRRIADELGRHVGILADLCGPKIRTGTFVDDGVTLDAGATVEVTTEPDVVGTAERIPSQYAALATDVKVGDRILLDDGKLELRVAQTVSDTSIRCEVVVGGRLSNRKGMNLPGVDVSAPSLTDKDRADAVFAAGLGVDYMALSFVRRADDVRELRALLEEQDASPRIVSKIEKPEALENFDEILEATDAIMVARGDLGVEMPAEEVPVVQQELVRRATEASRPVIVATQMLESMIENARPTRAEVTDVAFAAMGRADAVMLSAETAAGAHPVAAVETMDRVLRLVEGHQWQRGEHGAIELGQKPVGDDVDVQRALSRATSLLSSDLGVRSVVVPTSSGRMARMVSAERPAAPVIALSADDGVCRQLALCWGLTPVHIDEGELDDLSAASTRAVLELGLAERGQRVLLIWDASSGQGGLPRPTVSVVLI